MQTKSMISVNAATGLIEAIEAAGGDPDEILSPFGLDRSVFAEAGRYIAAADFTRVLERAATITGDDCFGLHFGERYHPKDVGPVVYVVLNSPTFAVGFENLVRYLRIHNEAARASFVIEGARAYLRHRPGELPVETARQHSEFSLVVGLGTIRLMAGSQWTPLEVQFAHTGPRETAEHERLFGAPVIFGSSTNALVVDREFVERPVPAADERLYPILKHYLDRVLEELPREDRLLASVRRAVAESMRNGDPTLAQVAGKMAMSPRTLQRRLGEYGMEFRGLVDDTRRRFALTYLRDAKNSLGEIAYLVGYSEVSAFNRAFKRWSGVTPSEYRKTAI
jgi:AraC-like DNA-binding protein